MNVTQLENINITAMMPNINPDCWGEYAFFVTSGLFLLSELLPFIKHKSNCENKNKNVIDNENLENQTKKIAKQPSVLENSNGLIHLAIGVLTKLKK